jgi:hypothetical protein
MAAAHGKAGDGAAVVACRHAIVLLDEGDYIFDQALGELAATDAATGARGSAATRMACGMRA